MWVSMTAFMMVVDGQSLPRGAAVAAVVALGGLAAWATYHSVSRRNDGLAAFIFVGFPITASLGDHWSDLPLEKALTGPVVTAVIMVVLQVFIGVATRLFYGEARDGKEQRAGPPLWGSDLDPPPSG